MQAHVASYTYLQIYKHPQRHEYVFGIDHYMLDLKLQEGWEMGELAYVKA